jgi:hypothetical protein
VTRMDGEARGGLYRLTAADCYGREKTP